jgi:hypothetical protein
MFDYFGATFLYNLVKDFWRFMSGRGRKLTSEEKIELRLKWKSRFEEEITKNWRDKLRSDVVVRDMRRIDNYPDIDERDRGISPWFRVGLIDLYHRGIVVGFGWHRLIKTAQGGWREKNYEEDKEEGENVLLAGRIPFENIEDVDWDGDEYYNYPHIYCHFSNRKSPYESVGYYTVIQNHNTRSHCSLLADVKDVQRRHDTKRWWSFRNKL